MLPAGVKKLNDSTMRCHYRDRTSVDVEKLAGRGPGEVACRCSNDRVLAVSQGTATPKPGPCSTWSPPPPPFALDEAEEARSTSCADARACGRRRARQQQEPEWMTYSNLGEWHKA